VRRTLIGLAAAAVMLLGACGDDDSGSSSEDLEANFMENCTAEGDEAICRCTWEAFSENLSEDELQDYVAAFEEDSATAPPVELTQAIASCFG
jgi:hypothetical protein